MRYQDTYLSLGAIDSGREGQLNIVGFDPEVYRGTPGELNGPTSVAVVKLMIEQSSGLATIRMLF